MIPIGDDHAASSKPQPARSRDRRAPGQAAKAFKELADNPDAQTLDQAEWLGLLLDRGAAMADAILDRLVHNAHKITLKGDSMRKRDAKKLDDKHDD